MKKTTVKSTTVRTVLLAALLLGVSLLLPACQDEKEETPTPRSEVPGPVVGQWLSGNFSMREFWDYDGSFSGNAFELGIGFDFKKDGECEFYLVTGGTSAGCRTEAFVFKKGTVDFTSKDSFTFYPTEGSNRGFYKGCASAYKDYDQKAEKKDLTPETYYYDLEKDSNGKNQLIIRFKKSGQSSTSFQPARW